MKALRTLLNIAKRDLELLQRGLAAELSKQVRIEERIRTHEQALIAEQQLAMRDYESHRAYGGYAAVAMASRRGLEGELAASNLEADHIRTLIAEAHVEMRKFERLIELEEERAREAAEKREDAELDEMATMRAGRAAVASRQG